jgi:Fur family transcriptional regulator, ferric uptake regulator
MKEHIEIMRRGGIKLTRPRKMALEILHHAAHPLSIKEIHKRTQNKVDLASVYRAIHIFIAYDIVRELSLGEGYRRYEIIAGRRHHHYVLCVKCGKMENIDLCLLDRVEKMTNYKIISHSMEFQGICRQCISS